MFSYDVNEGDFQKIVVEGSATTPVLVDFWAPWCEPCKVLIPLLEKLAIDYAGKFILAKVNTELHQNLAAQFQVRSIPSVKVFYRGQVVNEFTGVLPEAQLKQFINSILPSPAAESIVLATKQYQNQNMELAKQTLHEALNLDPNALAAKLLLATILLQENDLSSCQLIVDSISQIEQLTNEVRPLITKLKLASNAKGLPGETELRATIQQDDNNLDARLSLATVLLTQQAHAEAADLLLEVIRRDKNFQDGAARKKLLTLFDLVGNQDDIVRSSRKTLARLLN